MSNGAYDNILFMYKNKPVKDKYKKIYDDLSVYKVQIGGFKYKLYYSNNNLICGIKSHKSKIDLYNLYGGNGFSIGGAASANNIQKLHNVVKEDLLRTYTNKIMKKFPNKTLLDIGSGKGNDLRKWHNLGYEYVLGIDVDDDQINEANKRYKEYINDKKNKKINKFPKVDYIKANPGDLSTSKLFTNKFEIVTCNFVIHYLFKDESYVNNLFKLIHEHTMPGSYFIGVALDDELVKTTARDHKTTNNTLIIEPRDNFYSDNLYNREYKIFIDVPYFAKGMSTEYLVSFKELQRVAKLYDFILIDTKYFKDIIDYNDTISVHEKLASQLNRTFVFVRK